MILMDARSWRRGRDLNPRKPLGFTGFRNQPVQPLRHLSNGAEMIPAPKAVGKAYGGSILGWRLGIGFGLFGEGLLGPFAAKELLQHACRFFGQYPPYGFHAMVEAW